MTKKFLIHFGILIASGILIIVLLKRGVPQAILTATGDQFAPDDSMPSEGLANTTAINQVPGVNQTYNLPNAPTVQQPSADATYLTPDQVEATLAPQASQQVNNILSVGADYAEFVPTSQTLEG